MSEWSWFWYGVECGADAGFFVIAAVICWAIHVS